MYVLKYKTHFDSAHRLDLSYESKCQMIHGHRWGVIVEIEAEQLNKDGMIIDFSEIKKIVDKLDHCFLNDVLFFNTTAENIAKYLQQEVKKKVDAKVKVEIFESPNASISYEDK